MVIFSLYSHTLFRWGDIPTSAVGNTCFSRSVGNTARVMFCGAVSDIHLKKTSFMI